MRRLVPLLGALLLVAGGSRAQDVVDWDQAEPVDLMIVDNRFVPDRLVLRLGQPYLLNMQNQGEAQHEFRATEFFSAAILRDPDVLEDGAIIVQPGWEVDLYVVPNRAGTFPLSDAEHDWEGMVGEITVE